MHLLLILPVLFLQVSIIVLAFYVINFLNKVNKSILDYNDVVVIINEDLKDIFTDFRSMCENINKYLSKVVECKQKIVDYNTFIMVKLFIIGLIFLKKHKGSLKYIPLILTF